MGAALVAIGQRVRLETHEVEDRGVEIAEVDLAFDGAGAGFVGIAVDVAALHPAAGEPEGKAVRVVAGLVFAIIRSQAGTSEFTAPDDEGVLEEAALVEILEQGGDGRVGRLAVGLEIAAVVGC